MVSAGQPSVVTSDAPSHRHQLYIDGSWRDGSSAEYFDVHEPYSGRLLAQAAAGTGDDARAAIAAAAAAFPAWAATSPAERAALFFKAIEVIKRRQDVFVEMISREMGGTVAFARRQQKLVIDDIEQAAGWVYRPKGEVFPSNTPGTMSMSVRRPLGVVASFSPWNGANILAWRSVLAPIAAGNTVVLKPSELAPYSAGLIVAEVAHEAGFPAGVINVVTHGPGAAAPIADAIFETRDVRCVSLIGGVKTARMLAERAGRTLKRTVMELGGHNPMIILDDVNLDYAVKCAVFGSFFHQGQICMNTRRIIVQKSIYDAFLERFIAQTKKLTTGDPLNPKTIIGPLINARAVEQVHSAIEEAVSKGGIVRTGGTSEGQVFEPTILIDVPYDATICNEETFGPVVIVEAVDTPEDAVVSANRTAYGLASSILSGDTYRGLELAAQINTGGVNVNAATIMHEPHVPMGGVRDSGWGRMGPEAVHDFTDLIWITARNSELPYPFGG